MILEKNEKFEITDSMIPAKMSVTIEGAKEAVRIFTDLRMRYSAAIKEISTKLEILDSEFQVRFSHDPIHHMERRLKSVDSILGKLERKNLDFIVLNSLSDAGAGFRCDTNKVSILERNGLITEYALKSKTEVAGDIVNKLVDYLR